MLGEKPEGAAALSGGPRLDHAAFGNGRVLGLVLPTTAIEWLCMPRFDSPSIFARILDADRGGSFRFLAGEAEVRGELEYVANTNVVRSLFTDGDAAWEVLDFAPRLPNGADLRVPIEIVRLLRPLRGHPRISVDFDPRPDYARKSAELSQTTAGLEVRGAARPLHLATNCPIPYVLGRRQFVLDHPLFFALTWGPPSEPRTMEGVLHDLERTVAGWQAWSMRCTLPKFAAASVLRSALCLKLHAYHDTGAIVAAATTSIPEALGTPRTWDYRYCWVRDSTFVVEALRRLGHLSEGIHLVRFLREVLDSGPLQPVYGVGGERDIREEMLPHLSGFGRNGHVRIGNAASGQRQNDLMGELVLCLETLLRDPRFVYDDPKGFFPLIQDLVQRAIQAAPEPDAGIWEFRNILRPYTFSRAMCWAAIHRGALIADRLGHTELSRRWEAIAQDEKQVVLARGFNSTRGFFTQFLDGEHPDASNLLLPSIGLLDAHDPRFVSTVEAYQRQLVEGGFMLRYRSLDDFGLTTSAFAVCSFWWAEALALMGRLEDAVALFRSLVQHANSVGLFSEDIEPTSGALLGNFPQAYTHVGLIHAAITIGDLLEARDDRVRAWI